jgi:hypothetical protein
MLPPPKSGLGGLLPPPKSGLSGMLPPPKASAAAPTKAPAPPKKRQITIGSLASLGADDSAAAAPVKRPKLSADDGAQKPKHGLFGMLPTPSAPKPATPAEPAAESSTAPVLPPPGPSAAADPPKEAKGNDAFRAMLGLAPSKAPAKPAPLRPNASAPVASSSSKPSASVPAESSAKKETESEWAGFFGLGGECCMPCIGRRSEIHAASRSKRCVLMLVLPGAAPSAPFKPVAAPTQRSIAVRAAPELEEPESFPGWSQDPDGTWVPVTPAAHEQYAAWMASQKDETATSGGKKPRDEQAAEMARAGVAADSLRSVDAGADALAAYEAQAPARSDARYAAAAAAVGSSASVEDAGGEAQAKKSNYRAMRKGQLSALVAQAEQNRDRLEEKWAAGKAKQREGGSKYGF